MEKTTIPAMNSLPTVHLILQGKGGVGKSMVAAILGQFLHTRGIETQCIDTDPVIQTLMQYRALNAGTQRGATETDEREQN